MARRTIVVDGNIWKVYPAGRLTVYREGQLSLVFALGTGPERKRRFTRYSPRESQSTDAALAKLTVANAAPVGRIGRASGAPRQV
jgi:hypothetical protein